MARYTGVAAIAGAGAGVSFTQLRLADALSGTPEDPNSIFNSVTEDAAGWDVEIQGPRLNGMANGCWFRLPLPASWRGDGTQIMVFRFTEVTAGTGAWWCQAGMHDQDALAANTPNGIGGGVRFDTAGTRRVMASGTSATSTITVGSAALDAAHVVVMPAGPDDSGGDVGGSLASANAGGTFYHIRANTQDAQNSGVKRVVVAFGTDEDTSSGAVSGKVKIELAVVDFLPAGSLP